MSPVFYFYNGNKGALITKDKSGKICFPDKYNPLFKEIKEGDYWECLIKKEFDKYNIINPIKQINYNDQWEISSISDELYVYLKNTLDNETLFFNSSKIPDLSENIKNQIKIKIKEKKKELKNREIKYLFDKITDSNKKIRLYKINKLAFKRLKEMDADFPRIIDADPSYSLVQFEDKKIWLGEESAYDFDNKLLKKEKREDCINFRISETILFSSFIIKMIRDHDKLKLPLLEYLKNRIPEDSESFYETEYHNPIEHVREIFETYSLQEIECVLVDFILRITMKPILIRIVIADSDWGLHKADPTQVSYRITWDLDKFELHYNLDYNEYILSRISDYYNNVKKSLENDFIKRDYVHIISG